jgi:hypothetical protein
MKSHRASWIIAILALQLLGGCVDSNKAAPSAPTTSGPAIAGRWEWVSTDGSITGGELSTPASTGHTSAMRFSAGGVFESFEDGKLATAGRFTITPEERTPWGKLPVIHVTPDTGEPWSRVIRSLTPTELQLSDNAYDGVNASYVRGRE